MKRNKRSALLPLITMMWAGTLLRAGIATAVPAQDGLYATLQTTMGTICFELYYTNVPNTVANFVGLTEGTRPWIDPRTSFVSTKPYYNGIIFHRVISGFMIQGGSPKGDGTDGPGYSFLDEFTPTLRHDQPGIVSMANSGPHSNGGQFFITVAPTPWLNDKHSVFGRVVEGMTIVSNIASVATNSASRPLVDVTITNAFITRNGTNAQNFSVTNNSLPTVTSLPVSISTQQGITLSTAITTSSYHYIYHSTDLKNWTNVISYNWPGSTGTWTVTTNPVEKNFSHATRVTYTADTNMTLNPENHSLVMTMDGGNIIRVVLSTNSLGSAQFNNWPVDQVTNWSWKVDAPYRMFLFTQTDFPDAYRFYYFYTTPTNGKCTGYYYQNNWSSLGNGTFTIQPAN